MKIYTITPTRSEPIELLRKCGDSVAEAARVAGVESEWVLVQDGDEDLDRYRALRTLTRYVVLKPHIADNAGASPRAQGNQLATEAKADGVAFLDADNAFTPEHLANAVELALQGAEVVVSKRWNVSAVTGERMFVDVESNGAEFADTNTIVNFAKAAQFGDTWAWFHQPSGTDRIYWSRSQHSFMGRIACTGQPTVEYSTRWAAHFNPVGADGKPIWQPPDPAKFVAEENGQRIALVAKPVWDGGRWVPEGYVRPYDQKVTRLP